MTWSREFVVFATTSDAAVTVAKETARDKGLSVVTVAKVHTYAPGRWTVRLAVRGQEATEGV